MKTPIRRAAIVSCVALLGACGGGTDDDGPFTTTSTSAGTATSTTHATTVAVSTSSKTPAGTPPKSLRVNVGACGKTLPCAVSFAVSPKGFVVRDVTSFEADFDGDGQADLKSRSWPDRIVHSYAKPGSYRVRFTVVLVDGTRLVAESVQSTQNPLDAGHDLDAAVAGISSALRAQDVTKALDYMTPHAQADRGWALTAFKSQLPDLAAAIASAKPYAMSDESAAYKIPIVIGGETTIYDIVFIKDANGAWKIDSL